MTDAVDALEKAKEALKNQSRDEAFAIGRGLLNGEQDLGDDWGKLADMLTQAGDWIGALNARKRHLEHNPRNLRAGFKFVMLAADCELHDLAKNLIDQIQAQSPDVPAVASYKGWVHAQLGEFDEAEANYRRAIELSPTVGGAWFWLSKLGRLEASEETAQSIRQALEDSQAKDKMNDIQLRFALARTLDKLGDLDGAFAAYNEAAGIMAAETPFNAGAHTIFSKRLFSNYTDEVIEAGGEGLSTDRPIFVSGMPRSGTTLMQQLLTTDASVTSGGEVSFLGLAMAPLRESKRDDIQRYYEESRSRGLAPWTRLGQSYLHLASERFGQEGRFVDKQIGNSLIMGPAMAAMPDATFIWMRRNPPACALSIFTNITSRAVNWSWRLEDIALHMRMTERALTVWKDRFGDRLMVVDYEDVARYPEREVERVFAHAGMQPNENTLKFHEQKSVIATSSIAQVRQPISADKLDSWKKYEKHLQPFFDAYEAAGRIKMGVGD